LSYATIVPSGLPYNFPGIKEPDSFIDFAWDAGYFLIPVNDQLLSVSLSIKPWGTGELVASSLAVTGNIISFWLSGGIPGRRYTLKLEAGTEAGREWAWPIGLLIDPSVAPYPFPGPAANRGFGTAITWGADGTLINFGGYLALSTLGTWPTSSAGMLPGALYAASTPAPAYIYAVAGFGPIVKPPIFYNQITAAALLAHGAVGLPQTDPHVVNQIWISGDILCVSQG
jgi:hypothetical protein